VDAQRYYDELSRESSGSEAQRRELDRFRARLLTLQSRASDAADLACHTREEARQRGVWQEIYDWSSQCAQLWIGLRKYAEAEKVYGELLRDCEQRGERSRIDDLKASRALVWAAQGRIVQAQEAFQRLELAWQGSSKARLYSGWELASFTFMDDVAQTIPIAEKAVAEANSESSQANSGPTAVFKLAEVYLAAGRLKDAESRLSTMRKRSPDGLRLHGHLVYLDTVLSLLRGERARAVELVRKFAQAAHGQPWSSTWHYEGMKKNLRRKKLPGYESALAFIDVIEHPYDAGGLTEALEHLIADWEVRS
jgi:tetratricopeptide (TPR) repeat protein